MTLDIGITRENREQVTNMLNTLLADEYVLYTKTRNYHWNVKGSQFKALHDMFEEQYDALALAADEVAERAGTLGGRALGTLLEFQDATRLSENPGERPASEDMVADLVKSHETIIKHLRSDAVRARDEFDDIGTEGFLAGMIEQHEKMAWMLRSLLED